MGSRPRRAGELQRQLVLWVMGAVLAYTALSFAAAMMASQIMAIVHGTPVKAALEDRTKVSWYSPDSFLGYHPLNHRLWFTMATFDAMPPEALSKQRTLRQVVALQVLTLSSLMVGMLVLSILA